MEVSPRIGRPSKSMSNQIRLPPNKLRYFYFYGISTPFFDLHQPAHTISLNNMVHFYFCDSIFVSV
jgi:hypothetical protein